MTDFTPDRLILRLSPPWFDWWEKCPPARWAVFIFIGVITMAIIFVEKGLAEVRA